jgi:hypothetical protein
MPRARPTPVSIRVLPACVLVFFLRSTHPQENKNKMPISSVRAPLMLTPGLLRFGGFRSASRAGLPAFFLSILQLILILNFRSSPRYSLLEHSPYTIPLVSAWHKLPTFFLGITNLILNSDFTLSPTLSAVLSGSRLTAFRGIPVRFARGAVRLSCKFCYPIVYEEYNKTEYKNDQRYV